MPTTHPLTLEAFTQFKVDLQDFLNRAYGGIIGGVPYSEEDERIKRHQALMEKYDPEPWYQPQKGVSTVEIYQDNIITSL